MSGTFQCGIYTRLAYTDLKNDEDVEKILSFNGGSLIEYFEYMQEQARMLKNERARKAAITAARKAKRGAKLLKSKPRLGKMLILGGEKFLMPVDYWTAGDFGREDAEKEILRALDGHGRWG